MNNRRIGIIADCVFDISREMAEMHGIDIVPFYITTDTGRFRDITEITSQNILEYTQSSGRGTTTDPPPVEEYEQLFRKKLAACDELIHIAASSQMSESYERSVKALDHLGHLQSRIYVVDSGQISAGAGMLALKAAKLREQGATASEIVAEINAMKEHVSTSVLMETLDYMLLNGRVSKRTARLSRALNLHPVLEMKNGKFAVKSVLPGNMETAAKLYARLVLGRRDSIDTGAVFIVCCGCKVETQNRIREHVKSLVPFENVIMAETSATVTSNCGKGAFGIITLNRV